jgi:hypothetical protein
MMKNWKLGRFLYEMHLRLGRILPEVKVSLEENTQVALCLFCMNPVNTGFPRKISAFEM